MLNRFNRKITNFINQYDLLNIILYIKIKELHGPIDNISNVSVFTQII